MTRSESVHTKGWLCSAPAFGAVFVLQCTTLLTGQAPGGGLLCDLPLTASQPCAVAVNDRG